MDNLLLLCLGHHHALHDGLFEIRALGNGRWQFLRADGRELPSVVQLTDSRPTPIEQCVDAEPTAATSRWNGDRLDRRYAVSVLAERRALRANAGP